MLHRYGIAFAEQELFSLRRRRGRLTAIGIAVTR
jgi:hypothetical protein